MKQSRDLFLLSAIAFRQGKHADAGILFATAMNAPDSDEFLDLLNEEHTVTAGTLLAISADKQLELSLETASTQFTESLSSFEEDEDDVDVPHPSEEAEEDDQAFSDTDDEYVDDIDSDIPGQKVLPASLAPADGGVKGKPAAAHASSEKQAKIVISPSLRSPVKLRLLGLES